MSHWKSTLGLVLAVACVLVSGPASAVLKKADLGLTEGAATCDGKNTYTYTATWRSGAPTSAFQVNTGNQCALGGTVCGISTKGCSVTCAADASCSAKLSLCTVGKGAQWVKVTALNGTVYQQIAAPAPSMCP